MFSDHVTSHAGLDERPLFGCGSERKLADADASCMAQAHKVAADH